MYELIDIRGIETNNLKNINVSLKKNAINLILGPSGSGKSSLAYETIAQIGQYEYFSMFADAFIEPNYKVKSYNNMMATVPIKQTNFNNNMRSTIGTYFGLSKSIGFIYSVITGVNEEVFVLNKEANVCECCHGIGTVKKLDINKIINWDVPVNKVPMRCWNRYKDFYKQMLEKFCEERGIDSSKTFRNLTESEQNSILHGHSTLKYTVKYKTTNRLSSRTSRYEGVLTNNSMLPGFKISSQYFSDYECEVCHGRKFAKATEDYKVVGFSIGQFMMLPFHDMSELLDLLIKKYGDTSLLFSLQKLKAFVSMAVNSNLGHLYFNRSIPTLSGGELQRLRLVQVFNSQISDLMIILDEPLAGLSSDEKKTAYDNIIKLSEKHTVVLVDHGDTFLKDAKQVYVLGPEGGIGGGKIIDTKEFLRKQKLIPDLPKDSDYKKILVSLTSNIYSYSGVFIHIGLGILNLIYGKSGVGKSTMLREYFPQYFEKYVYINQKALVGNSNSSVATLLDIFIGITDIFAKKYKKDRKFFSNLTGCEGACPTCKGTGFLEYSLGNELTTRVECKDCNGTGFNKQLRKYKLKEKSIFDIWGMTVVEAVEYFYSIDMNIAKRLEAAIELKLGYLLIGQATSSLSGGENIRIKILKQYKSSAEVLGIDEPFKGLSNEEIYSVAKFLLNLKEKGKTVIVIDHTEEAQKYFSNIIELDVSKGWLVEKNKSK